MDASSGVWTLASSANVNNPELGVGIQLPANVCNITMKASSGPALSWFGVTLFQPASAFAPRLNVAKTVTTAAPYAVGSTIGYQIVATNTGNVALSNVSITDPNATLGACTPAAPAALGIGEAMTCQATHVVTTADMAAGVVDNTAAAAYTPPTVDPRSPPAPQTENSNLVSTPLALVAGNVTPVPANAAWALLLLCLGAFGLGARVLHRQGR